MLARCVMGVFSLARMRVSHPQPPFRLGGEVRLHSARVWLGDALGEFELRGPLEGLRHGDLVVVDVVNVGAQSIECAKVEVVRRSERERAPISPHVEGFAQFVRQVREFFLRRGLSEIATPSLVVCPGLEPSLEPFAVEAVRGREKCVAYLPTSPEIHLKKALAAGWTDIFEIKNCFRKGEFSPHHENEFLMLEWYRSFADLEMIRADLSDLLAMLGAPALTTTTFARLFADFLQFELTPATSLADLQGLCTRLELHFLESDTFNDLFHRVLIDHIEPRFAAMGPLIVRDFPPSQAALARLTSDGWADRFEFYWNSLEIANAFNEVTDPVEQVRRWELEQSERRHLGTSLLPQDPELIAALRSGIPFSGGVALGMERLYMALHGVREIRELKLFSSERLFGG